MTDALESLVDVSVRIGRGEILASRRWTPDEQSAIALELQRARASEAALREENVRLFSELCREREERKVRARALESTLKELSESQSKLAALTETHREALINLRGYASAMRDHKIVEHVNGQLAKLAAARPEAGKGRG